MAQESAEQRAERLARLNATRGGTRFNNVPPAIEAAEAPAKTSRFRGAGAPLRRKKDGTQEVVEDILTSDPDFVTEVPESPWGLYGHFCRVVRKHYPGAVLPSPSSSGKYLKWAKQLLGTYTREQIYEMIQVFVVDFKNLGKTKVFFKYSGTPTPTFDAFYTNHAMWVSYIGKGVIAIPAVRYSAYAEGYERRQRNRNGGDNESSVRGKTEVDPFDELRVRREE